MRREGYGKNRGSKICARSLRIETADLVHVTGCEINLEIFLIVGNEPILWAHKVILDQSIRRRSIWGGVNRWIGGKKLRDRTHHGYLVVLVGSEIVLRVVKLDALGREGGKVPLQHSRGQNARCLEGLRHVLSYAFVVDKEEELTSYDGTTQSSAKNVLGVFRDGTGGGCWIARVATDEPVPPGIGIEILVLQQIVGGSMKAICARFQNGDDLTAVGISIGRVGIGGDYAQLGDGVGRGIVADKIVLRFIVFRAFEHVVVRLLAVAIDRCYPAVVGASLNGIVSGHTGGIGVDGAGLEKRERGEVAPIQRDVFDFVGREGVSQCRVGRIQDGVHVGFDRYRSGSSDLQTDVNLCRLVDLQGKWGRGLSAEPRRFNRHGIGANRQKAKSVNARCIRLSRSFYRSRGVFRRDLRICHQRATGVCHFAGDGTGDGLSESECQSQ